MSESRQAFRRRFTDCVRDLLFPPKCVGCGTLLPAFGEGDIFCPACRMAFEESAREAKALPPGDPVRVSLTVYRPDDPDGVTQKVIYCLKHRDDSRVFRFLGAALAQSVRDRLAALPPETFPTLTAPQPETLLCAYPPRKPRSVRVEGVDQARRLAQEAARSLGAAFCPLFLRGAGRDAEQKKLSAAERQRNAEDAYRLNPSCVSRVRGRWILLLDDVCTTGATLSALTDLALSAGAAGVLWATVGQTEHRGPAAVQHSATAARRP